MALGEHFLRLGDELGVTTRSNFVSSDATSMIGDPLPHQTFGWMAQFDAIAEASTRFRLLDVGPGLDR